MIRRHVIRPQAEEDLESELGYFEGQGGQELANEFLDAVQHAVDLLYRHPEAGSPRSFGVARLRGLRSWPIPGFEDLRIYYLVSHRSTLRIVRILHGKRDVGAILTQGQN